MILLNRINTSVQKTKSLGSSFFLCLLLVFTVGCDRDSKAVSQINGRTMGTTYSVKIVARQSALPEESAVKAWSDEVFSRINQSMSTYIKDSEISQLNASSQTEWQKVSKELFDVLELSKSVSQASNGAFDISVGPLVNAWGFGPQAKPEKIPSTEEVSVLVQGLGSDKLELRGEGESVEIRKPPGLNLDLSAVAKGYAADALAAVLSQKGYTNYMVEVGGELALGGQSPSGTAWTIGIETPSYQFEGARHANKAVRLTDRGMATSGDYRNFYEEDGKRYSHTIDPRTGYPINHALASVTVIAETCAQADAWATALNVLGPEAALSLAESEGLAAYLLVKTGDEFKAKYSKAFKPFLLEN